MNVKKIIKQMTTNALILDTMTKSISHDQAVWKPAPQKWSVLEVVHHLLDEEKSDFRARLKLTLDGKGEPWPPFDPLRLVTEHKYNEQDFDKIMSLWLDERAESLVWLQKLEKPQWELYYNHPQIGIIRAGDLLVSWLEHDLLHFHQLLNLQIEYQKSQYAPFNSKYASP